MSFKDYFSSVAANYRRYRPDYPKELFEYLAALCNEHELAWDCATGNAQAAVGLLPYFNEVVATDASQSQLNNAPQVSHLVLRCEPANKTSLADHSVDLITVAQALHWFATEEFYQEVQHVLKPQGIIAAWTYQNLVSGNNAIDQLLDDLYWNVTRLYWSQERSYVDNAYQDILFPFNKKQAPMFFMEKAWTLEQVLGYLSTWSGLRACCEAGHEENVQQIFNALEAAWPKDQKEILFKWSIHLLVSER